MSQAARLDNVLEAVPGAAPSGPASTARRPLLSVAGGAPVRSASRDDQLITEFVWRVFLMPAAETVPRLVVFYALDRTSRKGFCRTVASTLAALSPRRVCLVHADGRSAPPRPRGYVPFTPQPPSFESLKRSLPDPIRTLGPNLWSLPLPSQPASGEPWMTPERAEWLTGRLRQAFGFVLVDAGSPAAGAEPLVLGRLADGAVLVVAADVTRREAACEAKAHLEAAGVRILGSVLTGRTFPIPEAIYRRL